MKKLPWLSLILLLGAYSTLSWLLYRLHVTWQLWAAVFAFALLQAFLLTTLSYGLQRFLSRWLKSDLGYFSIVLLMGLMMVFIVAWFHVFGQLLLLLSAEILARLDLRRAGYTRSQALIILLTVSILGLAVGGTAYFYDYILPQPEAIDLSAE